MWGFRRIVLVLLGVLALSFGLSADSTPRQLGLSADSTPRQPRLAARSSGVPPCARGPVVFGLIEATAGCLLEVTPIRWETEQAITVDGMTLQPLPSTHLIIAGPTPSSPGGVLQAAATLSLAGVDLTKGWFNWKLPAAREGEEKEVVSLPIPTGQKLFGLTVAGTASLRLGWESGTGIRYAKLVGNLELPNVFRDGPDRNAGGLTAAVGVRADRLGVHTDAVRAQVANAYVGRSQIKDLCLSYIADGSTTTTPCAPPPNGAQQPLTCDVPAGGGRWEGSAVAALTGEAIIHCDPISSNKPAIAFAESGPARVPSVTVRRVKEALAVDWTPAGSPDRAARAARYDVVVKLADGRKLLEIVRGKYFVSIPNVTPGSGAVVTVTGLGKDGTPGAGNTVTLAAHRRKTTG